MSLFAGIVLAAGRSTRFGARKLLAEIGGAPLVIHAARAALDTGLAPVRVVCADEDVRARVAREPNVRIVTPAGPDLSDSLKAGVAHLPEDVDAAFLLLADMPFVSVKLMQQIAAAWTPDMLAAAPVFEGQRGHPVLLAARGFRLVQSLNGDAGLGALLKSRQDEIALAPVTDAGCVTDIDTLDDFAAAAMSWPKPPKLRA